jgi:selenocysteine lyase/cysteine desulfurase
MPKGEPIESGGGTTKLTAKDWVIWADAPDRFEAGTPAIINVIAFALGIQTVGRYGKDVFKSFPEKERSATQILEQDDLLNYKGISLLEQLRSLLIGKNTLVPTVNGPAPFINLDNSASTPAFEPIWDAFRNSIRLPQNTQQEVIQKVKNICATTLGAPADHYDILFTTNTTEAINIAAKNLTVSQNVTEQPVIVNTIMEHSSNDLPWRMVPGAELIRLSVNEEGFINLDELKNMLHEYNEAKLFGKKRIKIVAVSGASNVLGSCNDLASISRIVKLHGADLLVDGAQLVAHKKVDMIGNGIDYMAFSAHKIYAPFGCGVLVVRKGLLNFDKDELESIKSSGEENTGGIAALGKAFDLLNRIGMATIDRAEQDLTRYALSEMSKIPGLKIYGVQNPDSSNIDRKLGVIVFSIGEMLPAKIANKLAQHKGIGVRTGCHCAHLIVKQILNISPGLERFQRVIQSVFSKLRLPGVTRVSFGIENTKKDVDALVEVLYALGNKKNKPDSIEKQTTQQVKKQILASEQRVFVAPD